MELKMCLSHLNPSWSSIANDRAPLNEARGGFCERCSPQLDEYTIHEGGESVAPAVRRVVLVGFLYEYFLRQVPLVGCVCRFSESRKVVMYELKYAAGKVFDYFIRYEIVWAPGL